MPTISGGLPVGAFVSVAGEGELTISAEATLSSSANLLATPGLPIIGTAAVTAGASVNVGAEWTASGEFELRLSRSDASTLHLAFYRRRGRSLSVSAKANAGVTATVRGKDMLATLMRAISPDPEADLLTLVNAGLDDEAIGAIQQAIAASIDRSLTRRGAAPGVVAPRRPGALCLRRRPGPPRRCREGGTG